MSESQLRAAKIVLGVVWILAVASFLLLPGSTMGTIGLGLVSFMVVAHVIECGVFWSSLRASGKPLAGEILQVILFGYFHLQTIK